MAKISDEEAFELFTKLMKGNKEAAKTVMDYLNLPFGCVSTITLYLAVRDIHDDPFAEKFATYLEQIKNPKIIAVCQK